MALFIPLLLLAAVAARECFLWICIYFRQFCQSLNLLMEPSLK